MLLQHREHILTGGSHFLDLSFWLRAVRTHTLFRGGGSSGGGALGGGAADGGGDDGAGGGDECGIRGAE